jgi:hypothetical protein
MFFAIELNCGVIGGLGGGIGAEIGGGIIGGGIGTAGACGTKSTSATAFSLMEKSFLKTCSPFVLLIEATTLQHHSR